MLKVLITFILLCSLGHSQFVPPTQFGHMIRDLYYSDGKIGDTVLMASEWTVEGLRENLYPVSACDNTLTATLGGTLNDLKKGSFTRTYKDLVSHNIIYFDIGVMLIGEWTDNMDSFTMKVDGSTLKSFSIQTVGDADKSDRCSGWESDKDLVTHLMGHFYHSGSSVTISFTWEIHDLELNSFAINNVSLTLRSTSEDPLSNPNNALLALTDTLVTVNSPDFTDNGKTNCQTGFYSNGVNCIKCHSACQECFGPSSSQCYKCEWNYGFDGTQCVQCADDNCAFCSGANNNQCSVCNPGYTLDFDGTCNAEGTCNTLPYMIKNNEGIQLDASFVRICEHSCPPESFTMFNFTCSDSCDMRGWLEKETGINWCEFTCIFPSHRLPNGHCEYMSCPDGFLTEMLSMRGFCYWDESQGCEDSGLYKHQNGSCLSECPYPYVEASNGFRSFCNLPCPEGYFNPWSRDCVQTCELQDVLIAEDVIYCDSKDSTNYTMNSTNGWCDPLFEFEYYNGSCLPTCPSPLKKEWHATSNLCSRPCPGSYYDGEREICVDSCELEYVRFENNITYCEANKTEFYTVIFQIHLRYDIPLDAFKSVNYLTLFLNILADLLDVDLSDITIISITEGSTIIDSKIELKSDSSDASSIIANKEKAATMKKKLESAAESKDLELNGIAVLNSKFNVVTPEGNSDSQKSSSPSKIVILIVIVAIAAVALTVVAFAVYRFKLKRKSLQVVNLKRAKDFSIEGNQAETSGKKRDEEVGILHDNSRMQKGLKLPTKPVC